VEPWESPVGPDGVTRIIVEAEDMQGVDQKAFGGVAPGWRSGGRNRPLPVQHVRRPLQSRTRTAMTDAGSDQSEIRADITVPKAGKYKLWVKYECPLLQLRVRCAVDAERGKDPCSRRRTV